MGDSATMERPLAEEALLLTGEIAAMYGVDPKTVRRWVKAGKLASICTPGGRGRRYPPPEAALPERDGPLLTCGEVAVLFRVDPTTVTRWAKNGKLTSIRTPGGHRRYRETDVRALIDGSLTLRDEE
jgi:excisionase family DNA binding protein